MNMKEIKPAKPARFEVRYWDDSVTRHRLAHRAIEAAKNGNGTPYAVFEDGSKKRIVEHQGALNGRTSVGSTRYIDEAGREFVRCADGHFEPAETRAADGNLSSWYTTTIIQ